MSNQEKFDLTRRGEDVFKWYGVPIELNLSFDNVLLLYRLLNDKEVTFTQKLNMALKMLVVHRDLLDQLSGERAMELIEDILIAKFSIDLRSSNVQANGDDDEVIIPTYDFEEDAGYIYASFLIDYNIDLFEQHGKLLWSRFLVLFKNLSDGTPMGQALYYRTCEVPKATKGNLDERKRIKKLKKKYELESAKPFIEQRDKIAYERRIKALKDKVRRGIT